MTGCGRKLQKGRGYGVENCNRGYGARVDKGNSGEVCEATQNKEKFQSNTQVLPSVYRMAGPKRTHSVSIGIQCIIFFQESTCRMERSLLHCHSQKETFCVLCCHCGL